MTGRNLLTYSNTRMTGHQTPTYLLTQSQEWLGVTYLLTQTQEWLGVTYLLTQTQEWLGVKHKLTYSLKHKKDQERQKDRKQKTILRPDWVLWTPPFALEVHLHVDYLNSDHPFYYHCSRFYEQLKALACVSLALQVLQRKRRWYWVRSGLCIPISVKWFLVQWNRSK